MDPKTPPNRVVELTRQLTNQKRYNRLADQRIMELQQELIVYGADLGRQSTLVEHCGSLHSRTNMLPDLVSLATRSVVNPEPGMPTARFPDWPVPSRPDAGQVCKAFRRFAHRKTIQLARVLFFFNLFFYDFF
jgi:hypothetical protein